MWNSIHNNNEKNHTDMHNNNSITPTKFQSLCQVCCIEPLQFPQAQEYYHEKKIEEYDHVEKDELARMNFTKVLLEPHGKMGLPFSRAGSVVGLTTHVLARNGVAARQA